MAINKKIHVLQVILVVGCLFLQGSLVQANDPQAAMKLTVEKVMEILSDPALEGDDHWAERRERVAQEVTKRFDFAQMAKSALAKTWNERSEAEREKFVTLFKELLKDTYVERLKTCCGGSYEVVFDKVLVRGKKAAVSSMITQGDREVSAVYKMYQEGDDWFVYDVVIEGVSLVSNYRSQFVSIIQKDGYEELVRRLEDKVAEPRNPDNSEKELS